MRPPRIHVCGMAGRSLIGKSLMIMRFCCKKDDFHMDWNKSKVHVNEEDCNNDIPLQLRTGHADVCSQLRSADSCL